MCSGGVTLTPVLSVSLGLQLEKGRQHPGGPAPQAAVGEDLHMAHAQVLVAEAGAQPQRCQVRQVVGGNVAGDAQLQLMFFA